jgi:ATP-dependent DNA helicase
MAKLAESEGLGTSGLSRINNVLMQMRKNCNHPELITSSFKADLHGPDNEVLLAQSGKLALLDRLLKKLHAKGHKVLIFSQVRPPRWQLQAVASSVCQVCKQCVSAVPPVAHCVRQ